MGQLSSAVQVTNGRRYGAGRYRYNQPLRRPVLVLHTMEGGLSYDVARRHENPPHLWYSPMRRELFQTVDLLGPAFALRHPRGTPETNNRGPCLQIELEGFARDTRSWPDEYYANIAQDVIRPLDRFCREIYGSTLVGGPTTRSLVYADELDPTGPLATTTSPLRISPAEWNEAHGLIGHQHIPFNTHWDPGRFRIDTLLQYLGDLDEPRLLRLLSGGQRLLRGTDVQEWQQLLAGLGFLPDSEVDGLFGPNTDAATRRFQQAAGLRVDGVVTTEVAIAAMEFPASETPAAPVPPPAAAPVVAAPSVDPAASSGEEADSPDEAIVDITDSRGVGGRPPIDAARSAVSEATATGSLAAPTVSEPVIDVRPPDVSQGWASNRDVTPAATEGAAESEPAATPEPTTPAATTPNATPTSTAEPRSAPTTRPTPTPSAPTPRRDDPSFLGRVMGFFRRLFGGR